MSDTGFTGQEFTTALFFKPPPGGIKGILTEALATALLPGATVIISRFIFT